MNQRHARLLDLGSEQSGVVTRAQAKREGLSEGAIDGCLANGLLIAVSNHVYRVRGAPQSEQMAVTAAALGSGGRASHSTAARLLRLGAPLPVSPIHVTVDAATQQPRMVRLDLEDAHHTFFAVKVHRFTDVSEPTTTIDGVPCVDAARAIIDIAPRLSMENLEITFERARVLGLLSTEALARRFAAIGGRGRPGTPMVRELLAHTAPNPLESKLEVKAWGMLRRSMLANPESQLRVDLPSGRWYRLDFAWPDAMVAFETEGFEWHGTRARWKQDRVRTAALERRGWRIVVGTWEDVVTEPVATIDRISHALRERWSLRRPA